MVDFHGNHRRFKTMSRFAALMMFLAWLLYGAMPVMAMPIMPVMAAPAMQDHSQHHDHRQMVETGKVQPSNSFTSGARHSHGGTQSPCPHGGKTCVTPFCAACLTLLPDIAVGDDSPFAHPYPAPAIELALISPGPAPLTPPPRA